MKSIFTLSFLLLFFSSNLFAQPDSELFPDFTHDDIEGVSHNLNSYLDDGKIVIIDVFATWCPICINSLPALHEIYDAHGPEGDNTIVILSFEKDPNTSNEQEFVETHNVPNAVIADGLSSVESWNTVYQPNYFVICPDRSFEYHFGGLGSNSSILLDLTENCSGVTDIQEYKNEIELIIFPNPVGDELKFSINQDQIVQVSVFDLSGKMVKEFYSEGASTSINISDLEKGIYFLQVIDNKIYVSTKKFIKR